MNYNIVIALALFGSFCAVMGFLKKPPANNAAWWARYNEYLRSPEWQQKRQGVLLKSGGRCEHCGRRVPIQVHHLPGSYKRIPHERPWDLAALCFDCHKGEHAK